jgi:hypothetical protein
MDSRIKSENDKTIETPRVILREGEAGVAEFRKPHVSFCAEP